MEADKPKFDIIEILREELPFVGNSKNVITNYINKCNTYCNLYPELYDQIIAFKLQASYLLDNSEPQQIDNINQLSQLMSSMPSRNDPEIKIREFMQNCDDTLQTLNNAKDLIYNGADLNVYIDEIESSIDQTMALKMQAEDYLQYHNKAVVPQYSISRHYHNISKTAKKSKQALDHSNEKKDIFEVQKYNIDAFGNLTAVISTSENRYKLTASCQCEYIVDRYLSAYLQYLSHLKNSYDILILAGPKISKILIRLFNYTALYETVLPKEVDKPETPGELIKFISVADQGRLYIVQHCYEKRMIHYMNLRNRLINMISQ